jgi:hypothetical protein
MARTSTLPKRLQPMLATLTDAPFDDKGWIFEDKYDGFRMVAKIEDGSVILYSRNGKIISHNYIEVAKALEGVKGDVLGRRFFVALHLPEVPSPSGGTALIWINDLLGPVGDQNFRAAYGAPAHLSEVPDIPDQRMYCFVRECSKIRRTMPIFPAVMD